MNQHVNGTFKVKIGRLEAYNQDAGALVGRMSIDKQFHGDLEATSQGEMLTAGAPTTGSAGYVAIERLTGTLLGKHGSFSLQHNGTIHRGVPQLTVTVVPDSGTGQLVGLEGVMAISVAASEHTYDFEFTLAETP